MISIDDHPSPDPSSSDHHQEIYHDLRINSDGKAPPSVSGIDLFLDDTNDSFPNFSIRDYVFSNRGKDIGSNWPFSQENLQLCLRNGVKNLLPPFQSIDSVRNNSSGVENALPDEELLNSCVRQQAEDQFHGNQSNQELEDFSELKSKKTVLVSSQTTNNTHTAIKKCSRLVVKFSLGVEPVEAVNNFVVSEGMASKVCPVCKTFSSSSNTTLNAHIDQCLSGESSMRWTANPKVPVKPRIKPRKTRLMVDIYNTAPYCTVEELDRRNGTSWANNSSFPAQELGFRREEEKEEQRAEDKEEGREVEKEEPRASRINPEVADREGAVYIDTDGTKVRILSAPEAGTSTDHGGAHRGKGKMKNKLHEQKRKICKHKLRDGSSQARTGLKEGTAVDESCNKEDDGKQALKGQGNMKLDDSVIKRPPWACSKRTGLGKKFGGKDDKLLSRHSATKDLLVESDKSSSGCAFTTPRSSSDNMISSLSPYREQPTVNIVAAEFGSVSPVGSCAKKRSPLLTRPSSKHLRKQGTGLNDSCQDPQNSCRSKRFEGSHTKPKGSKFSSLRKNLLSVRREANSASKFSLKRKFPVLKRSRVHCLSNVNAVVGPSQGSSEESRMEGERAGKMSTTRRRSLLKVRKKKEMKTRGQVKCIAVKRPTGDSSSIGIRNETQSHGGEKVGLEPTPKDIEVEGIFNVNPEFPGLVNQPHIESQVCITLYQDQLCSPEHNLEDIDHEEQGNYFHEVDPIPIPGPPGSFLPSPGGDIVSDEHQGNSSMTTTSRVQSSDDQHCHDMMDRDYISDSPISTISNPSLARSDSRSSDKFSVRSASVPDDVRPSLSHAVVEAIDAKAVPVTFTNSGHWRSSNTILLEKGPSPTSLKNDQPCCCSRKEGASSHTGSSNYQESALLKKRTLETSRRPSSLSFRPEMFSLSNYPSSPAPESAPETVSFPPTMKSPADSLIKLPGYNDCDSAASPSSQPVLRLMGKNLTVVKADEDTSSPQQFRPPPLSSLTGQRHPSQQFHKVQDEEFKSFSLGYPQRLSIISQNQNESEAQHLDVQLPNNFRNHVELRPVHALDTMFQGMTGGFLTSVDCYGHVTQQQALTIPQVGTYQGNRFHTEAVWERNVYDATANPNKEVLIIDGSPENEADNAMLNQHIRRNRVLPSASIPIHMPVECSSNSPRHLNPLYAVHQLQSAHPFSAAGGSPIFCNANLQTSSSPFRDPVNGNQARWNCTMPVPVPVPVPASMFHASSSVSPSPSMSRSSRVHYPPSFS